MEKVIILGHDKIDIDSIVSGILLEKLINKRSNQYVSEFVILDKELDNESEIILKMFNIDYKKYQRDLTIEDDKFILVDHNERIIRGDIVGIIDHHPSLLDNELNKGINKEAISTSCIIGKFLEEMGEASKRDIELALLGAFVDSCNFKSSRINLEDIMWINSMLEKYQLDRNKFKLATEVETPLNNLKKTLLNGLKQYQYNDLKIEACSIQLKNMDKHYKSIMFLQDEARKRLLRENLEAFLIIIRDIDFEETLVLEVRKDGVKEIFYDYYASRGSEIMPKYMKKLKEKNKSV